MIIIIISSNSNSSSSVSSSSSSIRIYIAKNRLSIPKDKDLLIPLQYFRELHDK